VKPVQLCRFAHAICTEQLLKKNDTFNDKQSEIAERKTGDLQGPGECGKNATERKSPVPTLHARRGHAGGRVRARDRARSEEA
jgi:hypothetical protein